MAKVRLKHSAATDVSQPTPQGIPLREVDDLLTLLSRRYPAAFSAEQKPLADGIQGEILAECGCDPAALAVALRLWRLQPGYLAAEAKGGWRYALDGARAGSISRTAQLTALQRLTEIRQQSLDNATVLTDG